MIPPPPPPDLRPSLDHRLAFIAALFSSQPSFSINTQQKALYYLVIVEKNKCKYNVCSMTAQRRRRWAVIVQTLYLSTETPALFPPISAMF